MARILYSGTHGTEDPTRASMPFIAANGAKEAGHDPVIALSIDAVLLMKDTVVENIHPVAFPALREIMATTLKNQTPIHV